MRKLILAMAAIAAFGLTLPLTAPAQAEEGRGIVRSGERHHARHWNRGHRNVVIQRRHHDRGLHRGWYKHRAESTRGRVHVN
jgi:hypothetical protein